MKVFVIGATGVLGRRTVPLLVQSGHEVTALARTPEKATLLARLGATATSVNIFDSKALAKAFRGHEVVFNLATSIPTMRRSALASAWVENDKLRDLGTRSMVEAAISAGVSRFIQESITFNYQDSGDDWITEIYPVNPSTIGRSALEAEARTNDFALSGNVGIVLRFGAFYGFDSSHTIDTVRFARHGFALNIGTESAFISPITTDDAASATIGALRASSGIYNVVDDEPLSRKDYYDALALTLGRKQLRLLPAFARRLGGSSTAMAMRSQRISNQLFKQTTSWSPGYHSARTGWHFVMSELDERGIRHDT